MSKEKQALAGKRLIITLLLLSAVVLLPVLCGGCNGKVGEPELDNYPYEPDTPAPAPHNGTFVSKYGTMAFNGDGETVLIDFDEELAERLGLPAGEQMAYYMFYTGYLPPHGYVPTRYDVAMMFELTVSQGEGAVSAMVEIGEYRDGQFYIGTDCTTSDRITFYVEDADGNWEPVDFHQS